MSILRVVYISESACLHTYKYVYMFVCICMTICVQVFVHLSACNYICMLVCVYMCMCWFVCVCVCVCVGVERLFLNESWQLIRCCQFWHWKQNGIKTLIPELIYRLRAVFSEGAKTSEFFCQFSSFLLIPEKDEWISSS